jgi:hypothetical protein
MDLRNLENLSHTEIGRYAGLGDLKHRYAFLDPDEIREYRIELVETPDQYQLRAIPHRSGGARRSFYCDETGIIRQEWNPKIADVTSAPLR